MKWVNYKKLQNYFEQLPNDRNGDEIAGIELNIGRVLYCRGELIETRRYCDKAYKQMMNTEPSCIKDSVAVLNNIGVLLQDQGKHKKTWRDS